MWTMSNIFMHGVLYQVLLRSESASMWAMYYTRIHYMFGASSMSGRISWLSMIAMGLCVIPLVRRQYYKVSFCLLLFLSLSFQPEWSNIGVGPSMYETSLACSVFKCLCSVSPFRLSGRLI